MRGHRPADGEVVDDVGHNGVGIALTGKRAGAAGIEEPAKTRQPIVPITVLFFDTQRAILNTQPASGVEAAVISGAAVEVAEKRTVGRDKSTVDPEGRRRDRGLLVRKAGPASLRSDVEDRWIGPPQPSKLRIRLGASERHGKRCARA